MLVSLPDLTGIPLNTIKWTAIVVGICSGSVAIYQFILKRPALSLTADPLEMLDEEGHIPITFSVENNGKKFAEDVFIQIALVNLEFIPIVTEGTESERPERLLEENIGIYTDYKEKSAPIVSLSKEYSYHMFYINDIVYSGIKLPFIVRLIKIGSEEQQSIRYSIACRSHEPKHGSMTFRREGENVVIEPDHPSLKRRLNKPWSRLSNRVRFW